MLRHSAPPATSCQGYSNTVRHRDCVGCLEAVSEGPDFDRCSSTDSKSLPIEPASLMTAGCEFFCWDQNDREHLIVSERRNFLQVLTA